MNKYELAVVVSAKLEDEERAAVIEKVKNYITRFNGTVTNVEKLIIISFSSKVILSVQTKWKDTFVLWNPLLDICVLSRKLN